MKIKCNECDKYISKPGFKNHLRLHNITFLEYLNKYALIVYYKDTDIQIPSYYCSQCNASFDGDIKYVNGVWRLLKIKSCCMNNKSTKNAHLCIFSNLDNYIKPNNKGRYTKTWWYNKYGTIIGEQKRQKWKSKCSGTYKNFIKRHGKIQGEIKWERFKERSKVTKNNFIKKYGEVEGKKKWDKHIIIKMETSPRLITYWLKKGYDIDTALQKKKEFNGMGSRLDYYVKKYGEKGGNKILKDINDKKRKGLSLVFSGSRSKISSDCFNEIEHIFNIDTSYREYYIKNETFIYSDGKFFLLDFYCPELNLWIEFNGDFYHARQYDKDDLIQLPSGIIKAKDIWLNDKNRKKQILYDTDIIEPFIIWEGDWHNKKNVVLNDLAIIIKGRKEKIEDKKNRDTKYK